MALTRLPHDLADTLLRDAKHHPKLSLGILTRAVEGAYPRPIRHIHFQDMPVLGVSALRPHLMLQDFRHVLSAAFHNVRYLRVTPTRSMKLPDPSHDRRRRLCLPICVPLRRTMPVEMVPLRDSLKMSRVHARRVYTSVVDRMTSGYRAVRQHIAQAMRLPPLMPEREPAITTRLGRANPLPTTGGPDDIILAFHERSLTTTTTQTGGKHMSIHKRGLYQYAGDNF